LDHSPKEGPMIKMIEAKITIAGDSGDDCKKDIVAGSLSPDNLSNMRTLITDDYILAYITTEKLGSLIATLDDYLMNVKVALDVCKL